MSRKHPAGPSPETVIGSTDEEETGKEIMKPIPRSREAGLVVQELHEEALVYDLERHKAHCLNQIAARVQNQPTILDGWRACEDRAHERADLHPFFG